MVNFKNRFSFFLLIGLLLASAQLFAQKKDTLDMDEVRNFKAHTDDVEYVVFSKDGKQFVSGGSKGTIILWSTETGNIIKRFKGHPSKVNHIAFSNDGTMLAAAFGYGTVKVWNIATGLEIRNTPYLMNDKSTSTALNFVAFSPDDKVIFFGGETAYLCQVYIDSNDYPLILQDFGAESIECATPAPDKKSLAFSVGPDLMYLDMNTGKVTKKRSYPGKKLTSFSFSNDGSKMAAWFMGGEVEIADANSGALVNKYASGGGNPWARSHIYFSPGDSLIISGTDRHSFDIWYVGTGKKKFENKKHLGSVRALGFHPDGEWILSGSADKTIKLWKFTGEEKKEEEVAKQEKEPEPVVTTTGTGWVPIIEKKDPVKAVKDPAPPVKDVTNPRAKEGFEKKPEEKPKDPLVYKLPYMINGRVAQEYKPETKLEFANTSIEIRVWDDKVLDGDIVSLYLNDSLILKEYEITKDLKKIQVKVPKGSVCYLTLFAHNLGTIPPNTANISISDGITEKKIELKSDMYKSASVELKVKY